MIDGRRIGILLATKNGNYDTYALNKAELESLLAAKAAGRVDEAYVVAIEQVGALSWEYFDEIEAEQLKKSLKEVPPRTGRYGDFYTLGDFAFENSDAPF